MNSKIIITIVIVVLVAAAVATHYYLNRPQEEGTPLVLDEEVTGGPEATKVLGETLLAKEGFEIILPPGWQEDAEPPYSILFMAVDGQEEISNQEINFRTNLTIKNDDLGIYQGLNNVQEYAVSIKESLTQAIPIIEFTEEKEETINGNAAYFIEIESTQEEIDFKTLLVFVEEADGTIWGLSFNAYQNAWSAYRNLFYQMARSFKPGE